MVGGDAFQAAVALGRAAECVNVHFEGGVVELLGEPCLVLGQGDRLRVEHHLADAGVVAPCVDQVAIGGAGGAEVGLGCGAALGDVSGDAVGAVGIAELGGGLADALLVFRLHHLGEGGACALQLGGDGALGVGDGEE